MKEIKLVIKLPELKLSFLLIIIFCLILWLFNIEAAILISVFFAFLIYSWDSRILGGFAIILLLTCFVFMIFRKENIAETIAIYAYYFLVITMVLQIVEFKKHPEVSEEEFFVQKK